MAASTRASATGLASTAAAVTGARDRSAAAVITITGRAASAGSASIRSRSSQPFITGIMRSRIISSIERSARRTSSASAPFLAATVRWPDSSSASHRVSRRSTSSSTTRITLTGRSAAA